MLLVLASLAAALTCDDVIAMMRVQVPDNVIVDALSQVDFAAADVPCLRAAGASARVVTAAAHRAGPRRDEPLPRAAPLPPTEPLDPLPSLAAAPDPAGAAARALIAHDPATALRTLAPVAETTVPTTRYLIGRALLGVKLPAVATPYLSLPAGDPLAASAATLLVDHQGVRPLSLVLEGVPRPDGPVPARVDTAFRLRDLRERLEQTPNPAADTETALAALEPAYGPLPIPVGYTAAVLLARNDRRPGPSLNLAAATIRTLLATIDAHHGQRLPRARAAELDTDRELAVLALGHLTYAAGRFDAAVALYDTIRRSSPRWPAAQLAAAEADAMARHFDRAFARLRPLLNARQPKFDWSHGKKAPVLRAGDFAVPAESLPFAVQRAWAQVALVVSEPGPCGLGNADLPRGSTQAYEASLTTLQARGRGWTKALPVRRIPVGLRRVVVHARNPARGGTPGGVGERRRAPRRIGGGLRGLRRPALAASRRGDQTAAAGQRRGPRLREAGGAGIRRAGRDHPPRRQYNLLSLWLRVPLRSGVVTDRVSMDPASPEMATLSP